MINKTIYKLYNFEVKDKFEIINNVWIESNDNYKDKPEENTLLSFKQFWNIGDLLINQFHKPLSQSEVIIGVLTNKKDFDNDPFNVEVCAYIAITLSIFYENFFVAGLETFYNNTQESPTSESPWTTLFYGNKKKKNKIEKKDYDDLKKIYQFVSETFKSSTKDLKKVRLLTLYLRSVAKITPSYFNILKLGLQQILNEKTVIIANSAIFFEHVFTKESRGIGKGVEEWNKTFTTIKYDEIDIIMQYRHRLFHDNPIGALNKIKQWKLTNNYDNQTAFISIKEISINNLKSIIKSIVLNYDDYLDYRNRL